MQPSWKSPVLRSRTWTQSLSRRLRQRSRFVISPLGSWLGSAAFLGLPFLRAALGPEILIPLPYPPIGRITTATVAGQKTSLSSKRERAVRSRQLRSTPDTAHSWSSDVSTLNVSQSSASAVAQRNTYVKAACLFKKLPIKALEVISSSRLRRFRNCGDIIHLIKKK